MLLMAGLSDPGVPIFARGLVMLVISDESDDLAIWASGASLHSSCWKFAQKTLGDQALQQAPAARI